MRLRYVDIYTFVAGDLSRAPNPWIAVQKFPNSNEDAVLFKHMTARPAWEGLVDGDICTALRLG